MSYVIAFALSTAGVVATCWSLLRGEALREDDEPLSRRIGPLPLIGLFLCLVASSIGLAGLLSSNTASLLDYASLGLQWAGLGCLLAAFQWGPRKLGTETAVQKLTFWGALGVGSFGLSQACSLVSLGWRSDLESYAELGRMVGGAVGWTALALMLVGTATLAGLRRFQSWVTPDDESGGRRARVVSRVGYGLLGMALTGTALLNVLAPTPAVFLCFLLLGFGLAAMAALPLLEKNELRNETAAHRWAPVGLLGLACIVSAANQGTQVAGFGATPSNALPPEEGSYAHNLKVRDELERTRAAIKQLENDILQDRVGRPAPARANPQGTPETYDLAQLGHRHSDPKLTQLERELQELRQSNERLLAELDKTHRAAPSGSNAPADVNSMNWTRISSTGRAGDSFELQDRVRPRR